MWKPTFTLLVLSIGIVNGYSKYGRSCNDINCLTNEACVMAEDPCRSRDEPCGMYPTCQKMSSGHSCSSFVCPPGQSCRMDGSNPKCVAGTTGTQTHSQPSAPIYPNLPSNGQTTTRPPMYRPAGGYPNGGYQGGSIGSGYPGQPGNGRPDDGRGSYPGYGGYPGYSNNNNGGVNQPGYPGYPGQPGYPSSGGNPSNGRYPSNYPNNYPYNNPSGGQNPYNQNPYSNQNNYGHKPSSASNPIYDTIKDTLKNIGLFCILLQNLIRMNGF